MPVPKRWFPTSHDIFTDPEVWEFLRHFGDRALITWLWFLSALDKAGNRLRLSGDWLASLSRMLRQTPASIQRQLGWMLAKGWLTVEQTLPDGSPAVLSAPNYWKYHRSREPRGSQPGSTTGATLAPLLSDPNLDLTNLPPNPPAGEEVGEALARFEEFRNRYPARGGMKVGLDHAREMFLGLSPDEQVECIAAVKVYAKGCTNGDRKPKDPDRFLKQKDGRELWREFIPLPQPLKPQPQAQPPRQESPGLTEEARRRLGQTEIGRMSLVLVDRNAGSAEEAQK
ncbi:MAG: hypothetical protein ABL970_00995 [Nitrospira sp.]